jgi:hypothetical protein
VGYTEGASGAPSADFQITARDGRRRLVMPLPAPAPKHGEPLGRRLMVL